ncbi:MAG: glucuronate isomerase, partial [Bacillota bacterium]
FDDNGCRASDHGVFEPISYKVDRERADDIHQKVYNGEKPDSQEIRDYKAYMLTQFGKMNTQTEWVTQLHIGAVRNYRKSLLEEIGPDTGGDIATHDLEIADNLNYFVNRFDPDLKIVLYSMAPDHWSTLATISRAFPNVSLGAAWWLNDSPYGMEEQLKYISTVDLLANFAGMVTDSRKLISYGSRTEMFRRVMCNTIGNMVERGQMPYSVASDLAVGLSYKQQEELFFV